MFTVWCYPCEVSWDKDTEGPKCWMCGGPGQHAWLTSEHKNLIRAD